MHSIKTMMRIGMALAFLAAMLLTPVGNTFASSANEGYAVTTQKVYASASTKAKTIGSLKKNQTVYIYVDKGSWSQIKYGKTKGWVAKKNLKLGSPVMTINKEGHATSTQSVYSSQSAKSKRLATVKKNQNVYVLAGQSDWYKVKFGKVTGWAVAKNFKLGKYVSKPPVGKTYPDGWTAPVLKSAWSPKHAVNLKALQEELGFKPEGYYGVKGLSHSITLSGESPESRDELEITFYVWTSRSLPESYRIPIVAKELFKLYFGKDATQVWNYMNKNDVPENFTANGRKVHVYFSEDTGSLTFQVGRKL